MKIHLFLVALLVTCSGLGYAANSPPYYFVDGKYEDNGVEKMWHTVLSLTDQFDNGEIAGFEIDFGSSGKHYNAERGANWWNYYFAFTKLGSSEGAIKMRLPRHKRSTMRFKTVCTMDPQRAYYLLSKYWTFQPYLEDWILKIKKESWPSEGPVVGVVYKKPMMPEIQTDWDPQLLAKTVQVETMHLKNPSIVLFTDQDRYITYFEEIFGASHMHVPNILALKKESVDCIGEGELLSMILMSQCDMLITPGTYQGIAAKMLAPNLNLIQLDMIPYALR